MSSVTAVDLAQRLPSIETVRALSRSFAALDAILNGDAHSYDRHWSEGVELAAWDSG